MEEHMQIYYAISNIPKLALLLSIPGLKYTCWHILKIPIKKSNLIFTEYPNQSIKLIGMQKNSVRTTLMLF